MKYAALLALFLVGCAEPDTRYLTKDEDQQLRERCEQYDSVGGCAAIPMPLFQRLIQSLRSCQKGQET